VNACTGNLLRRTRVANLLAVAGLPQRDRCGRVTLTRLGDAGGTTVLLVESPEPVSFIHDVTLALTRQTWH
jgi:hypothetical protein